MSEPTNSTLKEMTVTNERLLRLVRGGCLIIMDCILKMEWKRKYSTVSFVEMKLFPRMEKRLFLRGRFIFLIFANFTNSGGAVGRYGGDTTKTIPTKNGTNKNEVENSKVMRVREDKHLAYSGLK
jgi:hypothetical protein